MYTLIVTLAALISIVLFGYFIWDRNHPDVSKKLAALGLKFDNEDFSEATRGGNLPALKLYLQGGMSPESYFGSSDRFVLTLPAFQGTENFPDILKEFKETRQLHFDFVNARNSSNWFYIKGGHETLQDQLFLTLATSSHEDTAISNARALLGAGASPRRAIDTVHACLSPDFPTNYMGKRNCQQIIVFFNSLGVR